MTQVGNLEGDVSGKKPKDPLPKKMGNVTRERLDVCGHQDGSNFALGGVLIQECHPVAYESMKLNEAEHRYTTHEKGLLAVIHCLKVWRHYYSPLVS
ncbi:hypothetical protein RJ639_007713 [Escallonia herrerae]|uniref:Reverse transcriptase RNase H-like domain-containing protein n=1 Tax=Escallonia herrerae TaxID=1293975 RepID=A0AA88VYF0_9ASTE|nr:hypothetical protein RJ639_007713 [Escallonia herrerae]